MLKTAKEKSVTGETALTKLKVVPTTKSSALEKGKDVAKDHPKKRRAGDTAKTNAPPASKKGEEIRVLV